MGKREYFPKVKEARQVLREQALEFLERQVALINQAAAEGKIEAALEHNQWLIEHMPAEEGERIIDSSASKPVEIEGNRGPQIQIGIALQPQITPKQLGPETIDAIVVKKDD